MNTILCPTDFSIQADNALNYAIDLAKAHQFEVKLYHVVSLATIASTEAIYLSTDTKAQDEENMNIKVEGLSKLHPGVTFSGKVDTGLFVDCMKSYCDEINPVLVIMGMSGTGSTMDKIIGSHAIDAMNNLHHPMMIVPKNCMYKPIKNICFACDLKQVASSTPIIAFKLFTKLFNSRLHVLNIDYQNRNFRPETVNELRNLEELFENINHQSHFIENENVQDAIDEFIDKNGMDLLIMLPKKHSFFASLFKKSQTKDMLYHSHIPILALHQS